MSNITCIITICLIQSAHQYLLAGSVVGLIGEHYREIWVSQNSFTFKANAILVEIIAQTIN